MARVIHVISSECDIFVSRTSDGKVRIRIKEADPEIVDPADFEIEGDIAFIAEALATTASVLTNIDITGKEPN